MYKEYFGLEEMPFSIAPDPRYLYMSEQHREALAHLIYGLNSDGGFVLLTGEVGTGKTTVCRCLLEQIPENTVIAFIINPKLTVVELLATICDEFGIKHAGNNFSIKYYVDLINSYLLDAHVIGKKSVLIIDEAQNLSADVLEQLRLLTNLETNKIKLLQIILLGQPELRDKLSLPELRQLSQRVIARYHLGPLSKRDVASYVHHRLAIAGIKRPLFTDSAVDKLYKLSGGIPRLINVLCDRSLMGTFAHGKNHVSASIMTKASHEVFGRVNSPVNLKERYVLLLSCITLLIIGIILAVIYHNDRGSSPHGSESKSDKALSSSLISGKEVSASIHSAALQWPASLAIEKSRSIAFSGLFREWDLEYNSMDEENACTYAYAHGLQCYEQRGNLRILSILNHPAVLKLIDSDGNEFYIVLTAINGDAGTIMIGTTSWKVSLKDIESQWLGDFTLLWKIPPQYQGEIKPGDRNILVPWIDKQLALVHDRQYHTRSNILYDNNLVEDIKKFQIAAGIFPDGIIGPQTLMCLNVAKGNNIPLLKKKELDNKG